MIRAVAHRFWWEPLVLVRRATLVATSVVLAASRTNLYSYLSILNIFWLTVHMVLRPYQHERCAVFQFSANLVVFAAQ